MRTITIILLISAMLFFLSVSVTDYINASNSLKEIKKSYPLIACVKADGEYNLLRNETHDKMGTSNPYILKTELSAVSASPFVEFVNEIIPVCAVADIQNDDYLRWAELYKKDNYALIDATILQVSFDSESPNPAIFLNIKIDKIYRGDLMLGDQKFLKSFYAPKFGQKNDELIQGEPQTVPMTQGQTAYAIYHNPFLLKPETLQAAKETWINRLVPNQKLFLTVACASDTGNAVSALNIADLRTETNVYITGGYNPYHMSDFSTYPEKGLYFADAGNNVSQEIMFYSEDNTALEQYRQYCIEGYDFAQSNFIAAYTKSTQAVPDFSKEGTFLTEGRHLTSADKGNVCVISRQTADKNGLSLGDSISLQMLESMVDDQSFRVASRPFYTPEAFHNNKKTAAESFEIVGIYKSSNKHFDIDSCFIDQNTIFLPISKYPAEFAIPEKYYANTVSFKLNSVDSGEDFLADIRKNGHNMIDFPVSLYDNGYAQIASTLNIVKENALISLAIETVFVLSAAIFLTYLNAARRMSVFAVYSAIGIKSAVPLSMLIYETIILCTASFAVASLLLLLTGSMNAFAALPVMLAVLTLILSALLCTSYLVLIKKPVLSLLKAER